ncbi:hypothetical protein F4813DRAFT_388438 [Daldinia decipiens]|uniref:uncharacterized protein n=1 Tax=Daldinia decipiens TaxID=326647 RepID=UPI0020C541F5|nr:uncharacterized protein F4813DRAFT_388438 [Daldinia decipiens]KAI1658671.1 hypothetical protein F4813DRAFT_388438 [Daldinia decipiens]
MEEESKAKATSLNPQTNVTAGATHLLVSSSTPGINKPFPVTPLTFELCVTNWAYGAQIDKVHVAAGESLIKIPSRKRTETAPDIVVINLGTNDNNTANNVSTETYVDAYKKLIRGIHGKYPKAQVIMMVPTPFSSFSLSPSPSIPFLLKKPPPHIKILNPLGTLATTDGLLLLRQQLQAKPRLQAGTQRCRVLLQLGRIPLRAGDPHLLQCSTIDIGPQWHPTDVGAIKVTSHLTQFIKLTFGWELVATGPEIFHETLYWNEQQNIRLVFVY